MEIDEKLSKYNLKISEALSDVNLSENDRISILLQHGLKRYIIYNNDKEFFMKEISGLYDDLEEVAKSMGYLNDK